MEFLLVVPLWATTLFGLGRLMMEWDLRKRPYEIL